MSKGRLLFICIFLYFIISCTNTSNNSFLVESSKFVEKISPTHMTDIYIYSIDKMIEKTGKLDNNKILCNTNCQDCKTMNWCDFKIIDKNSREMIISEMTQNYESSNQNKYLQILMDNLNTNNILFAGCYKNIKKTDNEFYNFYEYMYFIDKENSVLFVFDYVGENY